MAGSSSRPQTPHLDIPLNFENVDENIIDENIEIGTSPHTPQTYNASNNPPISQIVEQSRKPQSWIWEYATRDRENEIVKCNFCDEIYKFKIGGGTGTIARHLQRKHAPQIGLDKGQAQIHTIDSQVVGNFKYNKDQNKKSLAKYIIRSEMPFTTSECEYLEEYIKEALNPQYTKTSRREIMRVIKRSHQEMRDFLIATFISSNVKFSLTCDTWKSTNLIYVICVTCHWIDSNWLLQKRIIAFQEFAARHTAQNIAGILFQVCNNFKIKDRIFSISFDNASSNTATIPILIPEFKPILNGLFFHNRCACHIINLCVQDGLQFIENYVSPIRDFIMTIRQPGPKQNEWKNVCKNYNKKPRKFALDISTRWNSTYRMLNSIKGYEVVIQDFYNEHLLPLTDILLTTNTFQTLTNVTDLLGVFELATNTLSGSYYPTSHLLIPTIVQIAHQLCINLNDSNLHNMIHGMQLKFFKYYEDIPLLNCVACLLDPTLKSYGLEQLLNFYSDCAPDWITFDVTSVLNKTNETLNALLSIYEQNHNASHSSETSISGSSSSPSFLHTVKGKSVLNPYSLLKKQKSTTNQRFNEITLFVNSPLVEVDPESHERFDILRWWKENKKSFPILSTIARDILTVPVSTVASESAFSAGGRVLDEKRRSMDPKTLEIVVQLKDWFDAEKRKQGAVEDWIYSECSSSSPEAENPT